MYKYFVVVDVQNDFVDGALGSAEAHNVPLVIRDKLERLDDTVQLIFTKDTHYTDYLETLEGKKLPIEHCIKGTHGWDIHDELKEFADKAIIFEKETFGCVDLIEFIQDNERWRDDKEFEITFVGLCTDICVVSNAMLVKSFFPTEAHVIIDAAGCAGTTPVKHAEALDVMASCQMEIKR